MNILVACEESQRVCEAFRKKGHNAFSCDIIDCSGGHPEWHIKTDVLDILNPTTKFDWNDTIEFETMDGKSHTIEGRWDMIIAFPPCTHLAVSGARFFSQKRLDGRQRKAIEFFAQILRADCDKIIIENPIGIISGDYIVKYFPDLSEKYGFPLKPTQIIHPWQFGDNYKKQTCLWEIGVPPLMPTVFIEPQTEYVEWIDKKTGKVKRQEKWHLDALKLPHEERAMVRSKTSIFVANAMAEQWG